MASGSQTPIAGSGGNDWISEYAFTDTAVTGASYAPNTSYDVIDGVVGQNGLTKTKLSAGAPPTDLVLRHLPGPLPWFSDTGVVDVTTMGADPTGSSDSTSAIQKAIDASLGHGEEVFLPRGTYLVSGTLHLHPDSRLFGVPGSKSTLFATTWDPALQARSCRSSRRRTRRAAPRKAFVGDLQIILPNDDKDSARICPELPLRSRLAGGTQLGPLPRGGAAQRKPTGACRSHRPPRESRSSSSSRTAAAAGTGSRRPRTSTTSQPEPGLPVSLRRRHDDPSPSTAPTWSTPRATTT